MAKQRAEFQIYGARLLADGLSRLPLNAPFGDEFMKPLRKLMQSKNLDVMLAWNLVYCEMIRWMSIDALECDVLPEAMVNSGLAQGSPFRIGCSRIFGALAERLDSKRVESLFYDKALSLCQDTDYEVRRSMCFQLNKIAKCIGPAKTEHELLIEYRDLLNDEEETVREAAIGELIALLEMKHTDQFLAQNFIMAPCRRQTIMPIWRKVAEKYDVFIVKEVGRFLLHMIASLTEDDIHYVYDWFLLATKSDDREIREMCCYNLPAMLKLYMDVKHRVSKDFTTSFSQVITTLAKDQDIQVRARMANCFSVLVELLGELSYNMLACPFDDLLTDDQVLVSSDFNNNVGEILLRFSKCATWRSSDAATLYLEKITKLATQRLSPEARKIIPCRKQAQVLSPFLVFADIFSHSQINLTVVPFLFSLLTDSANVKFMSHEMLVFVTQILAVYQHVLKKSVYREAIYERFTQADFIAPQSNKGRTKILFLEFCDNCLETCSAKFFKKILWRPFWSLRNDASPNVRYKMIFLLPKIKRCLRILEDQELLVDMNDMTNRWLTTERDKSVRRAMKEMTEVQKQMSLHNDAWLLADKKKEDDEAALLQLEAPLSFETFTNAKPELKKSERSPRTSSTGTTSSLSAEKVNKLTKVSPPVSKKVATPTERRKEMQHPKLNMSSRQEKKEPHIDPWKQIQRRMSTGSDSVKQQESNYTTSKNTSSFPAADASAVPKPPAKGGNNTMKKDASIVKPPSAVKVKGLRR